LGRRDGGVVDLLIFIAVIGVLLLGHELGHLLAAKASGVRVEEFGIGFPPKLAVLFHWRGTRFTLNAIPLGGFVRPIGEDDPTIPGGLAAASKRVRALVILAGPLANILLAVTAFTAAYRFAAPDLARVLITRVAQDSPAQAAGIHPGDIVLAVDEEPVQGFESMQKAISARLGTETDLRVKRDGQTLTVTLVPRASPPEGEGPIGVTLGNPTKGVGWSEAFSLGVSSFRLQLTEMIHLPSRLIRGEVAPEAARVTGLKGIYDMMAWAGEIDRNAQRPFLTLNLVGIISAGFAFANLLPIPALDGGRLMFVAFEMVFRRRLIPRHEGLAHAVGFILLLAVMIYVNLQDFVNPITLPK